MRKKNKKKAVFAFIPFLALISLCTYWVITTTKEFTIYTYGLIILLILIFTLSIYFKIVDYRNEKRGLKINDEFSKLITEKSGNMAFSWSIYMWLFILCFIDMEPKSKIIVCLGMIGMGFLYFTMKFYFSKRGI